VEVLAEIEKISEVEVWWSNLKKLVCVNIPDFWLTKLKYSGCPNEDMSTCACFTGNK